MGIHQAATKERPFEVYKRVIKRASKEPTDVLDDLAIIDFGEMEEAYLAGVASTKEEAIDLARADYKKNGDYYSYYEIHEGCDWDESFNEFDWFAYGGEYDFYEEDLEEEDEKNRQTLKAIAAEVKEMEMDEVERKHILRALDDRLKEEHVTHQLDLARVEFILNFWLEEEDQVKEALALLEKAEEKAGKPGAISYID